MKVVLCLVVCLTVVAAFPQQREGENFANEAIQQAQKSLLIPRDAQIENVQQGIQLAAYENIPAGQNFDLFTVLGDQVPREVIENLQQQISVIKRR